MISPPPSISARGSRSRSTARRSTSVEPPNPWSSTSADATRPDRRDRRRRRHADRVHPAPGDRHVRVAMDGPGVRHPAVARARRRERDELRGVPPRGVGAWPVRARTSCTRTSTARSATSAPACIPSVAPVTARARCRAGPTSTNGTGGSRSTSCRGRSTPRSGYLVTANNRIHDDGYPHLIGIDFHGPVSRASRHGTAGGRRASRRRLDGADPVRHRVDPRA